MQEGVERREALLDGVDTETPSIVVIEAVAIGVDVWLAGEATIGEPLFWSGLVLSLSVGFSAAYPVNVALVNLGVKSGVQIRRRPEHRRQVLGSTRHAVGRGPPERSAWSSGTSAARRSRGASTGGGDSVV